MSDYTTRGAPDYTDAFLVSFGVLIFMFLWMLIAVLGFVWAMLAAYGLDWLFQRLRPRRSGGG